MEAYKMENFHVYQILSLDHFKLIMYLHNVLFIFASVQLVCWGTKISAIMEYFAKSGLERFENRF